MPVMKPSDFPAWPLHFPTYGPGGAFVWNRAGRKRPETRADVLSPRFFDRLRGGDPDRSTRTRRVYGTETGAVFAFLLAVTMEG